MVISQCSEGVWKSFWAENASRDQALNTEKLLGKIVVQSDAADALAIAIAGYNTPNESLNSLKLNYDKKKYSNHKLNNAIRKALDKG